MERKIGSIRVKRKKSWQSAVGVMGQCLCDAVAFAFLSVCVVFVLFLSGLMFTVNPYISVNLLALGMMSLISFAWLYYRVIGSYK